MPRALAACLAGAVALVLNMAALAAADLVPLATAHSGLFRLLVILAGGVVHVPSGPGAQAGFHVVVGLLMAQVYAVVLEPRLPGPSWERGLLYAAAVWLANAAVVLPAIGEGFAGSRDLGLAGMVWFAAAHTLFFVVLALLYARWRRRPGSPSVRPQRSTYQSLSNLSSCGDQMRAPERKSFASSKTAPGSTRHRRYFLVATAAYAAGTAIAYRSRSWAENFLPKGEPLGQQRQLTKPGGGDNRATFMPDGRTLLFASKRSGKSQIWTMDLPTGRAQQFMLSRANDYGRVAPSPDGTYLSFSSDRSGQNVVYVLDTRRGTITPISDPTAWSFGPSWSSRNRIAYFSRQGGNRLNIWTVSPDGSDRQQVTNRPGESRQPWWSPDGTTLAFSADDGTERFQLRLAATNGADGRALTRTGNWQQPFWSPDGLRLATSAELDSIGFQILLIDVDGQGRGASNSRKATMLHPAWSPDGRSIVFTSGRDNGSALWRFDFSA